MSRYRKLAVLTTAVVAAVSSQTWATHYDSMYKTANDTVNCTDGGGYCQTDNATLRWYDETSISWTGRQNITSVLENSFEATVLSVSIQDPPSYTGDSETDIIYRRIALPAGVAGETRCDDAVSTTRCDQHYVNVAATTPDTFTICHESGHAIGLTHGFYAAPRVDDGDDSLACMQTPYSQITSAVIGSHNAAQVNATY